MSNLYELTQQLMALDSLLAEVEGDITEGSKGAPLEKWIEEYEWLHREKIDSYAAFIRNMESDIEAIKEEGKRLSMRARVLNNRIERLKAMAKNAMEIRQVRKLEGLKFTISIQKNGGKPPLELLVEDPAKMPDEFVRIVREPDSDKIRTALANGDPAAAKLARIGEPGESVRVK